VPAIGPPLSAVTEAGCPAAFQEMLDSPVLFNWLPLAS
jgi:hypothetical protein